MSETDILQPKSESEIIWKVPILAFVNIFLTTDWATKRNVLYITIENMYLNYRKQIRKSQIQ